MRDILEVDWHWYRNHEQLNSLFGMPGFASLHREAQQLSEREQQLAQLEREAHVLRRGWQWLKKFFERRS